MPINCRTLPHDAPRVAEFRTQIALGRPKERNALIYWEIPMGSIPSPAPLQGLSRQAVATALRRYAVPDLNQRARCDGAREYARA